MEQEKVTFLLGDGALIPRQERNDLLMQIFLENDVEIEKHSRLLVEVNLRVEVPQGYACHVTSNLDLVLDHNVLTIGGFYGFYSKDEKIRFVLVNNNGSKIKLQAGEKIANLCFFKMMSPNIVNLKQLLTL
jgi:dUTPase